MKHQFLLQPVTAKTGAEEIFQKWIEAKVIVRLKHATQEQTAALIAGTQDMEHEDFRAVCVEALGILKVAEAFPLLIISIDDISPIVRMEAIFSLSNINTPEATEALCKRLMSHDKTMLRSKMAQTLWHMHPKETAEAALIKALSDTESGIRAAAAASLGAMKSEKAVPALITLLNDSDYLPRKKAVLALGNIGVKESVAPLKNLADDLGQEDQLRTIAKQAIAAIEAA